MNLHVLRFPCCGRTYPCDVCHDMDQDHPMELATRMICGYCAKEQVSCTVDILLHFSGNKHMLIFYILEIVFNRMSL